MATKDPAKLKSAQRRYRAKKHAERYGPAAGNMSGRHDNHARGARNGRWKGGRFITSHGYVAVRVPADHPHAWGAHPDVKYAYEHILVMEAHLGRPLRPDEIVHHGPGGKQDNRIENLSVQTRTEHARHHDKERGRDAMGRFLSADLRVQEIPW